MRHATDERGIALVAALLVTTMMSALVAGFLVMVNADQVAGGIGRDQTQAYAAAHAGVEKLTADLGPLFLTNFNPGEDDLLELQTVDRQPTLPGISFLRPDGSSGYRIMFTDEDDDGNPDVANPNGTQIASGPYQGLVGLITPYEVEVTARTRGNAEVRMRRTLQTIAIPVFQFGLFSENNLSFHAGDDFSFGGRVHTNANLFIASENSAILTLADRVTAVGDIVRSHFTNGRPTASTGYAGRVRMARASNCPASASACRNLGMAEGSLNGNVGSPKNPNWANISIGTYNSYIRNGDTGARRLDLPLVTDNAEPIDLIRRPRPIAAGAESASLASQRFFNLASLRILLSDSAAELTGLPGVVGVPISLEASHLPPSADGHLLATSSGDRTMGYRSIADTPLIGGYILINRQDVNGNWTDVTAEILRLGITGRNISNGSASNPQPSTTCSTEHQDAIIRIQRIKDRYSSSYCNMPPASTGFWPNTLYDAREGLRRDEESYSQNMLYMGGVMHYVEFDVENFKRWIEGDTGTSGPGSMDVTGYVVYFSDRRTNKNDLGLETGEYGWEDFINPSNSDGNPNGNLDAGEDMNGNGTLQTYGTTPRITYTPTSTAAAGGSWGSTGTNLGNGTVWGTDSNSRVNMIVARANRAIYFRRALKVVNGGLGTFPSNGLQGLTIASENPVYVEGNFNACNSDSLEPCNLSVDSAFGPTNDAHRSAAIIADAVTLLSSEWNDLRSFIEPHDPSSRQARDTAYRMAVISGKGNAFPWPSGTYANFGSDGGAHNFLRFVEGWTNTRVLYRGSMVSLFTSRQAVGAWKCACRNVYLPADRGAFFDTEFLLPNLLPPRTPMFRDINTLTFRQILRPTQ